MRCSIRAEISTERQFSEALQDTAYEYVYAPMHLISKNGKEIDESNMKRIILVPPVFLGGDEKKIAEELIALRKSGITKALAHTLGHIELLNSVNLIPFGAFRLNITNSLALAEYEKLGLSDIILSIELTIKAALNMKKSEKTKTGIIAYGRLSLMTVRRCPVSDGKPCGGNDNCIKEITDRLGNKLPLLCGNAIEILNPDKLILSDKKYDTEQFDFIVLKFTDETNITDVKRMYENGEKPSGKLTRGLYYRGVE